MDFLALVETNRFKYWQEEVEFDDAWWFFEQAKRCVYELEAGRPMETHLRWFVPGTATISTPTGMQALHDDRLISAALIAEADKLIRDGRILTGRAESIVTPAYVRQRGCSAESIAGGFAGVVSSCQLSAVSRQGV